MTKRTGGVRWFEVGEDGGEARGGGGVSNWVEESTRDGRMRQCTGWTVALPSGVGRGGAVEGVAQAGCEGLLAARGWWGEPGVGDARAVLQRREAHVGAGLVGVGYPVVGCSR